MKCMLRTAALAITWLATAGQAVAKAPEQAWLPQAPPLLAPDGQVIHARSTAELFRAVEAVKPGGTILVADGHYQLPRRLTLRTSGVTLRSAAGDRSRVAIDGADHELGELIAVHACQGVTIADLTIQNCRYNGFKIDSDSGTSRLTIRNCVIHNVWQRGVKGVKAKAEKPRDCTIEYCLFYNDRPKTYADDKTDTEKSFQGNYVGAIDVMDAARWSIRDNVFVGIQGRTREGRGAIFVWVGSENCTIERNVIIDCDAGISLGNSYHPDGAGPHCTGCLVRNNFITRTPEQAIFAAHTKDCRILNNTIEDPANPRLRSIRALAANEQLLVANNLVSGPAPTVAPGADATVEGNRVGRFSDYFVSPGEGNLHLKAFVPKLVDAGKDYKEISDDIDRQPRTGRPDIGADELVHAEESPPAARQREQVDYVERMKTIGRGFAGKPGVVLHVGDSITYANPYSQWARYGQGKTKRDRAILEWMHTGAEDATDGWWLARVDRPGGHSDTACGGIRADEMLAGGRGGMLPVDEIIKKYRPQIVVLMLGTNDATAGRKVENYLADMGKIIDIMERQHTICILSTIPPHPGRFELAASYNQGLRRLAMRRKLPLIDFEQEILKRRPDDWNGTLLGRNDVHPTAKVGEVTAASAPTEENLRTSGYLLRAWLSVRKIEEVKRLVIDALEKSANLPPQQPADRKIGEAPVRVYSPRIISPHVADAYSMKTFADFPRWRALEGDRRALEVYKYLADTRTGLFHMNEVLEGRDRLSEFRTVRDPVKIINVYGYGYCGILGPTIAGVCQEMGIGPSRTLALPGWGHVAAETFYDGRWHYLDIDVRAVFRRPDGVLASLADARTDPSLWQGRGPLFFPNDPLEATRKAYVATRVEHYHGFHQTGHTMDYVLRPGETLTRWWKPQGGRWHHADVYHERPWLRQLIERQPRGPKPNHRHFTIHNHGNGRFVYRPDLTDRSVDFRSGAYDVQNVVPTTGGLTLAEPGSGYAVFEIRSPYIIVPLVGKMETAADDREASVVEIDGQSATVEFSADGGIQWKSLDGATLPGRIDMTPHVSGTYGYLLKIGLKGKPGEALVRRLQITTWVQVAPASLPALRKGTNQMAFRVGDHHGLPSRVMEVRSHASNPKELFKFLVDPPADYDPARSTAKIRGPVTVRVSAPPGAKIAWLAASGSFRTYQGDAATKTGNTISYAIGQPRDFREIYRAKIPTDTEHWHYNASREVKLTSPAKTVFVRYVGDPALNNFAIYTHCVDDVPAANRPVTITHVWTEGGASRRARVQLDQPGKYKIDVAEEPVNEAIEIALPSTLR